jgi:tRNA pseudouridine32 synthase/23S rRNA pseudouridine746 synthase/23S rRNA pseudouridine1911/1915/1917 synthase
VSASATRTLIEVLQQRFPDSSKTTLRQMLGSDRVRINGAPERDAKRPILAGDRVEIASRSAMLDPRVRILFEDADLIVIDKAAGLLSVPGRGELHETAETLLDAYLGARPGEARVHHVHRLDRDASGVLVFAKSTYVRNLLRRQFAAHDVDRVYVAIVHGKLREPAGTLRSFLAEGDDLRVRSVGARSKGKEAVTHYRTTASGARHSVLDVTLETGRRNQIRVQLAEAGHPVVGDAMYGKGRPDPLGRLALHARRLGFVHPRRGETVAFAAEPPPEFGKLQL